jgi:hypothetical protein
MPFFIIINYMNSANFTDTSNITSDKKKLPITDLQFEQVLKIITTTPLSMHKACTKIGISSASFYQYMIEIGDEAKTRYARAKDDQCDLVADDMQEIADECIDSNKGRLQVDTRKWYLSKIKPKRYGEHQTIEIVSAISQLSDIVAKVIRTYVPAERQAEAMAEVQTAIDFDK